MYTILSELKAVNTLIEEENANLPLDKEPAKMPCLECTGIERNAAFDVFSGRASGIKFHAVIAPLPASGNYRGGRLRGAAIADREDGSSYYYYQPNWTESDDQRVRSLLDALHDLAANWR